MAYQPGTRILIEAEVLRERGGLVECATPDGLFLRVRPGVVRAVDSAESVKAVAGPPETKAIEAPEGAKRRAGKSRAR